MIPKSIQKGVIYVGGNQERRRKVTKIITPKYVAGSSVTYVTIRQNGKVGAQGRCSLTAFAKWASKKDRRNGKPYDKKKKTAILSQSARDKGWCIS